MSKVESIKIGSFYRHKRTNNVYLTLGIVHVKFNNIWHKAVHYKPVHNNTINEESGYIRTMKEFNEKFFHIGQLEYQWVSNEQNTQEKKDQLV